MTETVSLGDASAQLSQLVERAAGGEEIIITKSGQPRARLVPLNKVPRPRKFGGWEKTLWIGSDFDDPLPDEILDAFDGGATP